MPLLCRRSILGLAAVPAGLALAPFARGVALAQATALTAYVADFTYEEPPGGESQQGIGPLRRLRSVSQLRNADKTINDLAVALVNQLNAVSIPAQRIDRNSAWPYQGWLVRGVLYPADTDGRPLMGGFQQNLGTQSPSVQASVSVSDVANNPDVPFIVFGTADAIRGQGVPVGWNPYVVAARFIVMKAEQMMDVQDVAREIAQQIWAHRAEVIAARQQAGGR